MTLSLSTLWYIPVLGVPGDVLLLVLGLGWVIGWSLWTLLQPQGDT